MAKKLTAVQRRKYHVRNRIKSDAHKNGRPRLSIERSNKGMSAQIIDDAKGVTLAAANTTEADVKKAIKGNGGNIEAATTVGKMLAERAKKAGVGAVIFDRGSYLYHGRVKALADGAREGGLEF